MSSKLEQFLTSKKIDTRQVLVVSKHLEGLLPADRALKLAKRRGKVEGADAKAKEAGKGKPRSGRAISKVQLTKIFTGKPVPGPARTRVLNAVNTILERKKLDKVTLADLFDLAAK